MNTENSLIEEFDGLDTDMASNIDGDFEMATGKRAARKARKHNGGGKRKSQHQVSQKATIKASKKSSGFDGNDEAILKAEEKFSGVDAVQELTADMKDTAKKVNDSIKAKGGAGSSTTGTSTKTIVVSLLALGAIGGAVWYYKNKK